MWAIIRLGGIEMNYFFHMLKSAGLELKPMCETCIYKNMESLDICEKHEFIPPDIQSGNWCDYYEEVD